MSQGLRVTTNPVRLQNFLILQKYYEIYNKIFLSVSQPEYKGNIIICSIS